MEKKKQQIYMILHSKKGRTTKIIRNIHEAKLTSLVVVCYYVNACMRSERERERERETGKKGRERERYIALSE